jgi:hypothetical protein
MVPKTMGRSADMLTEMRCDFRGVHPHGRSSLEQTRHTFRVDEHGGDHELSVWYLAASYTADSQPSRHAAA